MRQSAIVVMLVVLWSASGAAQPARSDGAYQRRQVKVSSLLLAVAKHDRAALARSGAVGVPYYLGYNQPDRPIASPFGLESLAPFTKCTSSQPRFTNIDWLTVQWECPDNVKLPWVGTETAFKFDGPAIVEIRTTPGARIIVSHKP